MKRFDCHTHWSDVWTRHDGGSPAGWLDVAARYGVTHAVVLPYQGLYDARRIADEHDTLARVCARSAGRMLPFGTACLAEQESAVAEIRRCLGPLGFRGIKFHPWIQGCSVSMPAMDAIAGVAAEYKVPILFHDGTPTFGLPSQIALLAQRHPETQFILGHAGLFEHYREAAAAVRAADNVWACLCGPHLGALRYLLAQCPLERLLWGSDAGTGKADVYHYRMPLMEQVPLTPRQAEAIYQANPQRLFAN